MGLIRDTLTTVIPATRAFQEGPLPLTAARVIEWLGGEASVTGVRMTPEQSLRQAAVYSCVRIISEDVASLPLITYRRLAQGKDRAVDHPLFVLLHDSPNPHMTAMQCRETMQGHLLLRGNAYAQIERDEVGRIVGLWPLHPDRMDTPVLSQAGTLLYSYRRANGEPVALTQSDVLHLRGLSPDGIMGYSPIALHRETLGNAQAMLEYGARFFGNNSQPGGYLSKKEGRINEDTAKRLKDSWEAAHRGLDNAHRVAVLEEGLEWHQIGLSNEDSQYLDSRKFSRSEIAGIFRVPPHKIGDLERATFSNIEEQGIDYVNSLSPFLRQWAQAIRRDLLTTRQYPRYEVAFDTDELTQASITVKYAAMAVLRQNGLASANDILRKLNENPIGTADGGDVYLINGNMVPVSQAVAPKPEPVKPEPDDSGDEELNARLDAIEVAVRTKPVEVHNHITTPDVRNEITVQPSQAPEVKNEFLVEAPVVHNHVAPAEVSVPVTVEAPAPTRTIVEKHVVRDSEGRMSHVREVHVQEDQT